MKKLAADVIHRVFQSLSKQDEKYIDKVLDKYTFMKSFRDGESESKWGKAIKKRKVELGRKIKALFEGSEKTFFTSKIFEKPSLWFNENGQCLSRRSKETSEKYLFRHPFAFERFDLTQLVTVDILMLEKFKKVDKSAELLRIKDSMIRELAVKFATDDIKISNMMKEILSQRRKFCIKCDNNA